MKKALIVDDSTCVRKVMEILVGALDFELIEEAENGKVAVQKYKEFKPDVVFMDIKMDEMDGLEALRRIIKYDPDANVIITSGLTDEEDVVEKAKKLGAKALLPKPLDVKDVEQAINKIRSEKDF